MRRQYARIRRSEAQAAVNRRKAEKLLQSISFVQATASESEKGEPHFEPNILKLTYHLSATKPLGEFLDALRKLYDIPIPAQSAGSSGNVRPTAGRENYLSWAVDKLMKKSEMDKISARAAEEQARAVFDSDDSTHTGSSSLGRLPPDLSEDEDDSMSESSTDKEEN
jgi:hypothetical protein